MVDKVRTLNQEDWKRTQIRMPQEQYQAVMKYAEHNNLSLNSAMLELLSNGLTSSSFSHSMAEEFKVVKLPGEYRRIVYGKFMHSFDLDYTQDLTTLRKEVESQLSVLRSSSLVKKLQFAIKNICVHEGAHHIDIIDSGVGSLNWLTVEDHWTHSKH